MPSEQFNRDDERGEQAETGQIVADKIDERHLFTTSHRAGLGGAREKAAVSQHKLKQAGGVWRVSGSP
jgi:hypothetical protein